MAVKIRLTRLGDKRAPFYRIVVADSRVARDAKYIDLIGTYNPLTNPEEIKVDVAKAEKWIANGAQPTTTAKALLKKAGVSEKPKKAKAEKETKSTKKTAATKTTTAKSTASKTTAAKKTTAKKTTKAEA